MGFTIFFTKKRRYITPIKFSPQFHSPVIGSISLKTSKHGTAKTFRSSTFKNILNIEYWFLRK